MPKNLQHRIQFVSRFGTIVREAIDGINGFCEDGSVAAVHQPSLGQVRDLLLMCKVNGSLRADDWQLLPAHLQMNVLREMTDDPRLPELGTRLQERLLTRFLARHGRALLGAENFSQQLSHRIEALDRALRGETTSILGLHLAMALVLLEDFAEYLHQVVMSAYDKQERRDRKLTPSAA